MTDGGRACIFVNTDSGTLHRGASKTPIYFCGLSKDGRTAVVEMRRNKDYLNCELYEYYGERETTKAEARKKLKEIKPLFIADLQKRFKAFANVKNVRIE